MNSVIGRSGQRWKLALALAALLAGSVLPAFAFSHLSWTWGTVLAVAGYAWGLLAIRCPACGVRWLWQASLDAGLYKPLFTRPACPRCSKEHFES